MDAVQEPKQSQYRPNAEPWASPGNLAVLQERIEQLKSRLRVAVIFSGDKSTPGSVLYQSTSTRPWKSYEAVAQDIATSLCTLGFRHVQVMPENMHLPDRLRREGIHLAWLNTAGVQGYNPTAHAPAILEMLGIPYVGHDPLAATMLDNKHAFKHEAMCAGIPTAPFCTWHMTRGPLRPETNSVFRRAFGHYPGPFVVKPVSGRASLHVHFVADRAGLPDAVSDVYRATSDLVLIEKFLSGREFSIAVTGRVVSQAGRLIRHRDPFTLAALERILENEEKIFTSMDVRSITQDRFQPVDRQGPNPLDSLRRLACEIFLEFNLQSLIRVDLRTDEDGNFFVLEANPKPDLKRPARGVTSLICEGLSKDGMDYEDLILSLLADRLDFLFTHRREGVTHITDLLDSSATVSGGQRRAAAVITSAAEPALSPGIGAAPSTANNLAGKNTEDVSHTDVSRQPRGAGIHDAREIAERINDAAADINLRVLNKIIARSGRSNEGGKADEASQSAPKLAAGST